MNTYGQSARFRRPRMDQQILVSLLSLALILATWTQALLASQDAGAPAQTTQSPTCG